jgi:hypothetical protein
MTQQQNSIPFADVLKAANELVSEGVIADYAIGGAMAAIFYVEPFTTYDIDLFYKPVSNDLDAGIPKIFEAAQKRRWVVDGAHLLCKGFPVQFLAAAGLTLEAVENSVKTDFKSVPTKVFRPEHIVAIAVQVGRAKDHSRITQILDQTEIDGEYLRGVLRRHNLKLEGYET